jgi:hypothetical protein
MNGDLQIRLNIPLLYLIIEFEAIQYIFLFLIAAARKSFSTR